MSPALDSTTAPTRRPSSQQPTAVLPSESFRLWRSVAVVGRILWRGVWRGETGAQDKTGRRSFWRKSFDVIEFTFSASGYEGMERLE